MDTQYFDTDKPIFFYYYDVYVYVYVCVCVCIHRALY